MKRKRNPGAGRKPSGPFANNSTQLTIRMPEDLRHQLEKSATKKGWSLTQELLWRLNSSYKRQRERKGIRGHPAVRALGFLVSELISRVAYFDAEEWHRDPFLFRAFRLGVGKLLEALEPPGDVQGPYQDALQFFARERRFHNEGLLASFMTPEARADFAAKELLSELLRPDPRLETGLQELQELRRHPSMVGRIAERILDRLYGLADVRRDLGINQLKVPTT